jgi:hypothetical protein
MLSYCGQDMDCELIGLRKIDGDKIDPGFHQVRYESDVPRKPVEFGYHKGRPMQAAGG